MPGPGTWSPGDILTADDLNAIGVWQSYTPVLSQNGVRTATINYAQFCVINKVCFTNVDLTCTTSGSAGHQFTVSLPLTPVSASIAPTVGSGIFFDESASDMRLVTVLGSNLAGAIFIADDSTTSGVGDTPSIALANNDVISFSVMYEVD
jgi:hypothetical protein